MALRSFRNLCCIPLAAVLLLRAAPAAPAPEAAAKAARTAIDRAQFAEAERIIDDALARFATRDEESMWALRVMRGEMRLSTHPLDVAARELAFPLPEKYAHTKTGVRLVLLRALATGQSLEPAKKLAEERQPALLGEVYVGISARSGREEDARLALHHARAYGQRETEARAVTNLLWALSHAQRLPEAVAEGTKAVSLAKQLRLPKLQQAAEGNLGWVYFELGDYEVAEELFRSANRIAREIGANRDRIPWLIQLGNIEHEKRNWQAAIQFNQSAVPSAAQFQRTTELGYAYANIARAALELGHVEVAAEFNAKALAAKKGEHQAVLSSRVVDARIAALRGNPAGAEKIFREVLAQKLEPSIHIEADTYFALLLASAGRNAEARTHFERASRVVGEGRARITDRDLRFAFLNTAAHMFDEYVDFLVRIGDVEGALAVTEWSRAQSLEEGLNVPRKLNAREIAKANDATILSYWLGRTRSLVWVITPGSVTVYPLAADTKIEHAARSYHELLVEGGTPERGARRATELYGMLIRGVDLSRSDDVIVIPDGALHTLNFETLMPRAGRYWIEDAVVMNAPSLELLARGAARTVAPKSLLLVGDAPAVATFPRLAHAPEEIGKVTANFTTRHVLRGAQATPDAYKAAARKKYDVQHFVAHGVASRRRPLDSAIILAADPPPGTYRLLASDIMQLPLDARLVTISSCHGVGTRTYVGEGVIGLAWAFLKAGADHVIAALWQVNDSATPQMMDAMYREMRNGRKPADALRAAKLRMIRGGGAHRKPLYWAPFVIYAGA